MTKKVYCKDCKYYKGNKMKLGYLLASVMILLPYSVYGYVPITEINDTYWKFYNGSTSYDCYNELLKIDPIWRPSKIIYKVMPYSTMYSGWYPCNTNTILIYGYCQKDVFAHELAHYNQELFGDDCLEIYSHSGKFWFYYEKISG